MKGRKNVLLVLCVAVLLVFTPVMLSAAGVMDDSADIDYAKWADVSIDSIADLSIDALRARDYGSTVTLVEWLGVEGGENEYQAFYAADGTPSYNTYMAAYMSDGNRVYSRVDVPSTEMPEDGYPVVIFIHGWVGESDAPNYTLNYYADAYYGDIIDSYVDAGNIVLMPGWRGHSTVDGIKGEGVEFMSAFDNGSYISPLFYGIDILNLIDGIQTLESNNWSVWGYGVGESVKADLNNISISGHSQGGDSVLTALAVSGEGSNLDNKLVAGSIWSGCFPDRITQAETYAAMGESAEAFKAGTQEEFEWNGTAIGADGSVNPNFIFAWAPDWIGSVDASTWGWQADYFGNSVEDMLNKKFGQMYDTINTYVADINDAEFTIVKDASGKVSVVNDPRIEAYSKASSAFWTPEYLVDETIILQHSDQDYYALPEWNASLAERINAAGGDCADYTYAENNHSLKTSGYEWFDVNGDAVAGRETAIERDIALFDGQ